MSEGKTPATEAGLRVTSRENIRWFALLLSPSYDPDAQADACAMADEWFAGLPDTSAIEAEARETEKQRAAREGVNGFQLGLIQGRADALREAAEKYRALKFPTPSAVLAILTEQER